MSKRSDIFHGDSGYISSNPYELASVSAREESHLPSSGDVFFDFLVAYEVFLEFKRRFVSRIYYGYIRENRFDMVAYDGVVGASENECLYIRIEPHEVFPDSPLHFGSMVLSSFDHGNESGGCDLLDYDGIVMEMYAFLIGADLYGRFRCENPDFPIPGFDRFLGAGNRDPEYFPVRETDLLEVSDGMRGRRVAGEYDDGGSLVEKEPDPFLRILPYGRIVQVSVGASRVVAEIAVIVLRQTFAELPEYGESSESGIEESDHGFYSKIGRRSSFQNIFLTAIEDSCSSILHGESRRKGEKVF